MTVFHRITRSNGRFFSSVYRKPTFTGLFTNFRSFVPSVYKRALVYCLLHRIFHLCSSYENFHASTIFSNPNLLSSLFLRKSSIFALFLLVHIPSKFALELHDFVVLLILISTFALSFALLHVLPLSFLLRIEFPSF